MTSNTLESRIAKVNLEHVKQSDLELFFSYVKNVREVLVDKLLESCSGFDLITRKRTFGKIVGEEVIYYSEHIDILSSLGEKPNARLLIIIRTSANSANSANYTISANSANYTIGTAFVYSEQKGILPKPVVYRQLSVERNGVPVSKEDVQVMDYEGIPVALPNEIFL